MRVLFRTISVFIEFEDQYDSIERDMRYCQPLESSVIFFFWRVCMHSVIYRSGEALRYSHLI